MLLRSDTNLRGAYLTCAALIRYKPVHNEGQIQFTNFRWDLVEVFHRLFCSISRWFLTLSFFLCLQPSFLPPKPGPNSPAVCPVSIPVSENTHFRVIPRGGDREHGETHTNHHLKLFIPTATPASMETEPSRGLLPEHKEMETETIRPGFGPMSSETEQKGRDNEAMKKESEPMGAAAARLMTELDEGGNGVGPRPLSKTDSPSKRKGIQFGWFTIKH